MWSIYVPNLNKSGQSAAELLTINDRFFVCFRRYSNTARDNFKTRGPICTKLGGNIARSSLHTKFKMLKISCSVSKPQRLKVERCLAIRPKIALFDTCKIRGGVGEICGLMIVAAPMTEPLVYV